MLLLYLSTLALAFPLRSDTVRWPSTVAIAVLLLLTALTIPTAGVFLALILVQAVRRAVPWQAADSGSPCCSSASPPSGGRRRTPRSPGSSR